MFTTNSLVDKRVILNDLVYSHLNGKRAIITEVSTNSSNDIIACTNIPHPEDKNTFLWINISCGEASHILEYEGYTYQYINDKGENITIPYTCTKEEIRKGFKIIGSFDVYLKIPLKL
jgi:hypothetical protein